MNLFELQTRANILVDKVNEYESSLTTNNIDEEEVLAQQKYVDIYSLRPVLKLLFGDNVSDKTDRVLLNNKSLPIYASTAPMWNTKFNLLGKDSTFVEPDFEQPVLSSNGTLGGNSFAVACSSYYQESINRDAYNATVISLDMDNSRWQSYNGRSLPQYLIYYNPQPIRLTILQLFCAWPAAPQDFEIQGSNDNSTYTTIKSFTDYIWDGSVHNIEINETNSYKYYRLYITKTRYGNSHELAMVGYMKLIGKLPGSGQPATWDFSSDKHEFMSNIDMLNAHNMIQLDATQKSLEYNNEVYSDEELRTKQGINYLYSSNIQDAVATESQIANMFKWNTTTSSEIPDNTITTYSQVPGIVMYYIGQGGYDFYNTPTISHSDGSTLNSISTGAPVYSGGLYLAEPYKNVPHSTYWVWSQEGQGALIIDSYDNLHFSLKQFIPGTHYAQGRLESPQQIFIPEPDPPVWESSGGTMKYNITERQYQGHALYHELVFKGRRSGAKENEFDFIPTLESVADNDPQGLATRLALAKNKDYYVNRPFFEELSTEYEYDSSKLADLINEKSYLNYNYYSINSTYITGGNLSSIYDAQTDIISGNPSTPACIKSLITTGTDNDNPGTSGPNKYVSMNFGVITDWSTITSTSTVIASIDTLTITCNLSGTDIIFGYNNGARNVKVPVADLTNQNNLLILQIMRFGQRASLYASIVNKSTNEVTTYYSAGPSFTTTTSNIKTKITLNQYSFQFDFTPRDLSLTVDFAFGRPSASDVGMIKEYDKPNNIDRSVYLTDTNHVDRPMTDSEFYNQYKLDYETYAEAFDLPQ